MSANTKRLDRIYHDYESGPYPGTFGDYAARRSVLAVCAATVPDDVLLTRASAIAGRAAVSLRDLLRRLARGAR